MSVLVSVCPPALRGTARLLADGATEYSTQACRLLDDLPVMPPLEEGRVALELGWAVLRLRALAAELDAEAQAQTAVATAIELADDCRWMHVARSVLEAVHRFGAAVVGDVLTALKAILRLEHGPFIRVVRYIGPLRYGVGVATDVFDYSPWGPRRREGYLSSGFAGAAATDAGFTWLSGAGSRLLEAVVGGGVEEVTAALAGGVTGAEVTAPSGPGVLAGAAGGIVIGGLLATDQGQALERSVKARVRAGIDTEVRGFRAGVRLLDRLGEGVLGGPSSPPAFPGPRAPWWWGTAS